MQRRGLFPDAVQIQAAPFWRRLLAAWLDWAFLLALLLPVGRELLLRPELLPIRVLPLADHLADLALHHWPLLLRGLVLLVGGGLSYLLAFQGLVGRTPGERIMGLGLLGPRGSAATTARVLLRSFFLVPSMLLLGAGFWWAAADSERRTLYERLSGTYLAVRGGA